MSIILKSSKVKFKDPDSENYVSINAISDSVGMIISAPPSTNGTYTLRCVVSNGTKTYSWVSS